MATVVSHAAYHGPLAGGLPASLYPAGVNPQSCPNYPHCANPAVAVAGSGYAGKFLLTITINIGTIHKTAPITIFKRREGSEGNNIRGWEKSNANALFKIGKNERAEGETKIKRKM